MEKTPRIIATPEALTLIQKLKSQFGDLIFHQSGGCCDGSSPMCFEKNDFKMGGSDVGIGTVEGVEFWMAKDQFEYWQHTQLCLDIVQGRGSSFSIEIPSGYRFIIRSRIYSEEESKNLDDLFFVRE